MICPTAPTVASASFKVGDGDSDGDVDGDDDGDDVDDDEEQDLLMIWSSRVSAVSATFNGLTDQAEVVNYH